MPVLPTHAYLRNFPSHQSLLTNFSPEMSYITLLDGSLNLMPNQIPASIRKEFYQQWTFLKKVKKHNFIKDFNLVVPVLGPNFDVMVYKDMAFEIHIETSGNDNDAPRSELEWYQMQPLINSPYQDWYHFAMDAGFFTSCTDIGVQYIEKCNHHAIKFYASDPTEAFDFFVNLMNTCGKDDCWECPPTECSLHKCANEKKNIVTFLFGERKKGTYAQSMEPFVDFEHAIEVEFEPIAMEEKKRNAVVWRGYGLFFFSRNEDTLTKDVCSWMDHLLHTNTSVSDAMGFLK